MLFLQLANLQTSYDNAPQLCGVNFTVERWKIAYLLSSSGSGEQHGDISSKNADVLGMKRQWTM